MHFWPFWSKKWAFLLLQNMKNKIYVLITVKTSETQKTKSHCCATSRLLYFPKRTRKWHYNIISSDIFNCRQKIIRPLSSMERRLLCWSYSNGYCLRYPQFKHTDPAFIVNTRRHTLFHYFIRVNKTRPLPHNQQFQSACFVIIFRFSFQGTAYEGAPGL